MENKTAIGQRISAIDSSHRPIVELIRDVDRNNQLTINAAGLIVDARHSWLDLNTYSQLLDLVDKSRFSELRDNLFKGDVINNTEDRAVLHTALRSPAEKPIFVNGENIAPLIQAELEKMKQFVRTVHDRSFTGSNGERITDIVNIGIGGSDLGPRMAVQALSAYRQKGINVHFISNVDPTEFENVVKPLSPLSTLFVVASKTFTTQETMTNASLAQAWVRDSLGVEASLAQHFVAVTTNVITAKDFGIPGENIFGFWDWVGGRFSLMSSIGLSVMLAIGVENFSEMLAGAHEMDEHFSTSPDNLNAPLLLSMLSILYRNVQGLQTEAVLPYSYELKLLPSYLQQLSMESNGKHVSRDGHAVDYDTAPVLWGAAGTDAQHSFIQLLHQGTTVVPVDFIGFEQSTSANQSQHKLLLANMKAQAEALTIGRPLEALSEDSLAVFREISGDRPSTTITADKLTPKILGSIVALYEHKIFCLGALWNINSFDQFGVELGKELAKNI
jgi:glucose-6-phosphate isomerase